MAKKEVILSETLESDGHLPSFKDGVGVFPPGSDWAEAMLTLKVKDAVFSVTSFLASFHLSHDPNHTLVFFFSFWLCKFKRQEISVEEGTTTYGKRRSFVCRRWKSRLC